MQRIAFRSLGAWIVAGWHDFADEGHNAVQFGAVSFAVALGGWILSHGFQRASFFLFAEPAPGFLLAMIVSFATASVVYSGLTGVAVARQHERLAEWPDFVQSMGAHAQAILAQLFGKVLLGLACLLPGAILAGPGVALMVGANANPLAGLVLVVLGAIVTLVVGFFVWPLQYFAVPLTIERRMDFYSALLTSIDCVRRDWLGLAVYHLIAQLVRLPGVLFCPLLFLTEPAYHFLTMRAYRGYFGLGADRHVPPWVALLSKPAVEAPPPAPPTVPPEHGETRGYDDMDATPYPLPPPRPVAPPTAPPIPPGTSPFPFAPRADSARPSAQPDGGGPDETR